MNPTILFSQVREDPSIEMQLVRKIKTHSNILLVGSGGCTLLSILGLDNTEKIDCVDMSQEQLKLIKLKIAVICYFMGSDGKESILKFFHGDYCETDVFHILEQLDIPKEEKRFWRDHPNFLLGGINQSGCFESLFRHLVVSGFEFEKIFDRKALISIFGESAVVNSLNKEFSDHFRVILDKYRELYKPEDNYFYHQILYNRYHPHCLPPYFDRLDVIIQHQDKVRYIQDDFVKFISEQPDQSYDLVHTSNLTDWMCNKELNFFLQQIHRVLNPGGYVVLRRLNGDYNLQEMASAYFLIETEFIDRSHFYSEVVVGKVIEASSE